jgi:hypothetical protein
MPSGLGKSIAYVDSLGPTELMESALSRTTQSGRDELSTDVAFAGASQINHGAIIPLDGIGAGGELYSDPHYGYGAALEIMRSTPRGASYQAQACFHLWLRRECRLKSLFP